MVKLSIFDGFCDDEAADDEERYVSHITHGCSHNTWMCFFFPRGMCLAKQQASKSEEEENRKLKKWRKRTIACIQCPVSNGGWHYQLEAKDKRLYCTK